jgi:DNA repair protein SbcC/Rad50
MEILSVSLTNFKSHSDRHFTFQPGTNAICGENGAGKTSILEAIAWVLFNHKGAYRTEDLIRNGAASAQVTVSFISSRDERTYQVSRCTRSGYTLYDPQIGEKLNYSRIDDEVMPWLRQNLGVPVGTDLAKLFANTIGVPQGTFTADFLKPVGDRKPIFDTILKVEEYRQANQALLSLEKYSKAEVESLERAIAQYEDTLQDWATLSEKRQGLNQEIEQVKIDLTQWQQRLSELQVEQTQLSEQATQIQQLTQQLERLQMQIAAQSAVVERLNLDLQQAEQAVAICTANREHYQTFQQAEQALQALDQQRASQAELLQKRQRLVEQLGDRQTQLATLTHQLERITAAQTEMTRLAPLTQQQAELAEHQQALNQQLQACQSWHQTLNRDQQRCAQLTTRQTQLHSEIEQLQALAPIVAQISHLEEQQQRYQQQLSRIAAATQFEADLRQIVTQAQKRGNLHDAHAQAAAQTLQELEQALPIWASEIAEIAATLNNGSKFQSQLLDELQGILADLAEQVVADRLQQHLHQIEANLQTLRRQQVRFLTLAAKLAEQQQLASEIAEVEAHITTARQELAIAPDLQQQLSQLQTQLTELDDPKGRSRLLQQEIQAKEKLAMQQQQIQATLTEMQATIAQLDQTLADFSTLAEQIQTQQARREEHRSAYTIYLENQQAANSLRSRQQEQQAATEQLQTLQQQTTEITAQHTLLAATYDPVKFQAVQMAYAAAQTQQITLSAKLPEKQTLLADYDQQLTKLQAIQAKRDAAQIELKQKQKADRFIKFARKVYKEAGPRITERYVQNISRTADQLFRELLNRPNVALEWTREYEIIVREGAHDRRFVNLSGGEQMCAALAVRLALLKVLADINIAFFDEPTTNMDKPRREHLAAAIGNIRTFRQLFVISHDDTFEQVTENVILVEREV